VSAGAVLPGVDDDPLTETGVILLGLDTGRLLAGLGLAAPGDDPAQVALAVDRSRHEVPGTPPFDDLVAAGRRRWRAARPLLADRPPPAAAALRGGWLAAVRTVRALGADGGDEAAGAYLAACWLRRDAVDRWAAEAGAGT
jgi:hypothetical protein